MPAAQLAVLDVTCELPLQVAAPAYLALPTWDTHCAHGGMGRGLGRGEAGVSPCRDMPTCASGCTPTVVCLPAPDMSNSHLCTPTGPTVEQIEAGVAWSERQVAAGRGVLVHCAHGHGRSAAMLAAILIARGDAADVAGAVAMLVAARPRVRLNARQQAGLAAWLAARKGRQ